MLKAVRPNRSNHNTVTPRGVRNVTAVWILVLMPAIAPWSAAEDPGVEKRVEQLSVESPAGLRDPLYIIQAGDSLQRLAADNGWDKRFVEELKALNQLSGEALVPGHPLVIPGPERAIALQALNRARTFMKAAVAANAGTFAIDDFKVAVDVFHDGDRARGIGSYHRARLLGDLAARKFQDVKALADSRALEPKSAKLNIIGGTVFHSINNGLSWNAVTAGIELAEGHRVRTESGAAAVIVFEDGSRLLLKSQSSLVLVRSRVDQRTERSSRVLDLEAGTVHADVPALKVSGSDFVLSMGAVRVSLVDTRVLLYQLDNATLVQCCYRGTADVQAAGQSLLLPQGYGSMFVADKGLQGPFPLLRGVDLIHPPRAGFDTASQNVHFAWRPSPQHKEVEYELSIARDVDFGQLVDFEVTRDVEYVSKPLPEGIYFARVRTSDRRGLPGFNSETVIFKVTMNLGIQLGAETKKVVADGATYVAPKAHVAALPVSSNSSVVSIEYRIDEGTYFSSDAGVMLGGTGSYAIRARGVAVDGHLGEEQLFSVIVDDQAPQLRVHVGEIADVPGYGLIRSVSFIAEDNLALDRVEYRLDGKAYKPYEHPLKLPVSRNFKIKVRAFDVFGNMAETGMGLECVKTRTAGQGKGLFKHLFNH